MVDSTEFNWKKEELAIGNLSLWDQNARFPDKYFNKKEPELINYFLGKKSFKIKHLAKEIVQEFDLPQLEKIVVYDVKGKKIVLEGNRRLTVYKLLVNPELGLWLVGQIKGYSLLRELLLGMPRKRPCVTVHLHSISLMVIF